jgi:hypothetical protein
MKNFIYTGWYAPTLSTTEDPELTVIERDNGCSWSISFYVGNILIDYINMKMFVDDGLNQDVLRLLVYSPEGVLLGPLYKRLEDAYHIMH